MKKAFTLVELLVVISIISILTIVTVSQFQTARKKANDVQRKGDLSSLGKALQMYYTDYGYFPEANNGKIHLPSSTIEWGTEFVDNGYVYMKVMPIEKKSGWNYCYKVSADQKKFALFANLENTSDKDCSASPYSCNGGSYCFTIVSPNSQPGESL